MILTVTLNPSLDRTIELNNFIEGDTNRINTERTDAGGKGINVSKVIKELKGESLAITFFGGKSGDTLLELLDSCQINYIPINIQGETRTNIKLVDSIKHKVTDINAPGPNISGFELQQLISTLKTNLSKGDIVVFSGSTPRGISSKIYMDLIETAKAIGALTVLDADSELLSNGISAKPNFIKPNIHELEKALKIKLSTISEVVSACHDLIELGIENILVSMGSQGSVFVNQSCSYLIKPLPVAVRSTVGAGDALVAGMVYAFNNNYEIESALKLATACATSAVTSFGTQAGNFSAIIGYMDQIELIKI